MKTKQLRRLLVLDDDPLIAQLIELVASEGPFEVRSITHPHGLFDELERWRPTDLALDLVMPGMDGMQVIDELARRGSRARIVITSGVGSRVLDAAARAAAERGLDVAGVLAKPFSASALRKLLRLLPASGGSERRRRRRGPEAPVDAAEVRHALAGNELGLVYQPKVECATGRLVGFETLVRWRHPTRGQIAPDDFLPVVEALGLMGAMTDRVVRDAFAWTARIAAVQIAVNLSGRALSLSAGSDSGDEAPSVFADQLVERCHEHGLEPHRVVLELTETSAMADPVAALSSLTRLRMKGFLLSIDDFGSGFSSMLQLVRLPFSEMKIDRSFVTTARRSAESRAVIRCVVSLSHALGLVCVAEGVEDSETLGLLTETGCDLAQGYHIARPMPAEQARDWAAARSPLLLAQ